MALRPQSLPPVPSWSRRSVSTRSMWYGPLLGPTVGSTKSDKAMAFRLLASIGRHNGRAVPKGTPVSNGRRAGMCPAIPSCASGLTRLPVVRVPPVRCVPQGKTPRGNSPSGHKPTTKPSRPRAYGRRRPSSEPNRGYGQEWRAVSRKAFGALVFVRIATSV
jgi:hypothetical protein